VTQSLSLISFCQISLLKVLETIIRQKADMPDEVIEVLDVEELTGDLTEPGEVSVATKQSDSETKTL